LIQLHLVLIYAMAGLAKLQGQAWWSGMAIWGTLAAGEFSLLDFTWLAAWPYLLNLLTHAALAIELCYGILVWVRLLRPLVLAAAVALHVGIALNAPGLIEFSLAMIAANLAFVPGAWLRSLVAGRGPDQPALRTGPARRAAGRAPHRPPCLPARGRRPAPRRPLHRRGLRPSLAPPPGARLGPPFRPGPHRRRLPAHAVLSVSRPRAVPIGK
jgi:hypothetical protein